MPIKLQDRDLAIMKYVFASRVATQNQIYKRCFKHCARSILFRRLSLLEMEGYLKMKIMQVSGRIIRFYESTEKAFDAIGTDWPFLVDRPKFQSESPNHDLRLNEIHSKFEKLSTFDFLLTENLLQSSLELQMNADTRDLHQIQSDAGLFLKEPDGRERTYAIEYELTRKARHRYVEKFRQYYKAYQIFGVLYVCPSPELIKFLEAVDRDVRRIHDSILYFAKEENVLQSQEQIIFTNSEGHQIELF